MQYSAIFIQISSQSTNKIHTCVFIYLCVLSNRYPTNLHYIFTRTHTLLTHTNITCKPNAVNNYYYSYRINDSSTLRLIHTFVSLNIYMCVCVSAPKHTSSTLNIYSFFIYLHTHNTITHINKNTHTF
jgi:hypothetical protein